DARQVVRHMGGPTTALYRIEANHRCFLNKNVWLGAVDDSAEQAQPTLSPMLLEALEAPGGRIAHAGQGRSAGIADGVDQLPETNDAHGILVWAGGLDQRALCQLLHADVRGR